MNVAETKKLQKLRTITLKNNDDINYINRARGLYREISDRSLFVQTEPVRRGLYIKKEVRYLSGKTEQVRLTKSLSYNIRHAFALEANRKCMNSY